MGVTIDSIQIEIESNSASATQGLDNFAKSLEALKKTGKVTTVVKNLNALSTAIKGFSSASGASTALGTLATAIEKLRSAGSIASQANNLTKLQTSLKALETVNIGNVAPKIKELADSLKPLSDVKSGGFGTLINSLAKLDQVTKSLDDEVIGAFTAKIALLNEKLAPFAEKMGTIKSAFNAINKEARSAKSGVDDFSEGIDASSLNLASFIEIARTVIDTIRNVIEGFKKVLAESIEWDGISARFGRGFGAQAQETYAWIQRLNEEMGINIQQFMKYSSVYATMLTGFGVANEDAGKMALGYTELTYDIWAGYNDIYKTFDEAAEAVKSAIAGEVEPVRRAGFTIIESTLEQTAANHGLEISLANATEAQKSYLRYLTLVDQAHAQGLVGTYAKELNTAEGLTRTLAQQMKSLSQAFGSLFLPILVRILPYIQAFVELLTEAVHWIASLFGIEIQAVDFSGYEVGTKALDQVANSAGNAANTLNDATKAAKDLKKATIGIDELNVISPSSAAGGSGSGSGVGSGGTGFDDLDINSLWDESIFDSIQTDVDSIKEKLKGWLPVISAIAAGFTGLRLIKLFKDIKKITGGAAPLKKFFGDVGAFFSLVKEGGWISTLAAAFPKISTAISGAATAVGSFVAGISAPVWGTIAAVIAGIVSVVYFLYKNWDEVTAAVKRFFDENISPKLEKIGEHFEKIKEVLKPIADAFAPIIDAVTNFFKLRLKFELESLGKLLEIIGGILFSVIGAGVAYCVSVFASFIENVVQVISGVVQQFGGLFDMLMGIMTLDGERFKEGWRKLVSGIGDVFGGLIGLVVDPVVEIYHTVIDWFTALWDELVGHSIVPDTINAIVKWFTSLPSKIFGSVEKFTTGIVDKFKGMWSKLVGWWNGKTKLKEYTPSIGSIYDKLKSRWDSARTWWNSKKSKLNEYTPSIGSIYDKLSARWKNARDWWNGKKAGLKTYTPSIGSITDKLKSAWNSAKSWWNKNVKLSTKLNIQVPTIKVKWDTASAFGKSFKYPKGFSLKFAANGGIFDQGSLIWAGERGPEIMANAGGGKTGVMNVQQMYEAMYDAVYSATIAANRSSGGSDGSRVTKLYLDGREITSAVEKTQHERGANIMGFSF